MRERKKKIQEKNKIKNGMIVCSGEGGEKERRSQATNGGRTGRTVHTNRGVHRDLQKRSTVL